MNTRTMNGDQALAYGAFSSGVKLVTSYPGSPSAGTVDTLISMAQDHGIYVEWSSNEKVAIEMGIGASIAGRRALVCAKSVGVNLMVDPLMALNLTPVKGGLVILLGDDPGAYGSQNDQDTRPLATMLEMPMLEPASPAEGYAMMREAFAASEKYNTAVIIRETRSFTQQVESVSMPDPSYPIADLGFARELWRFFPAPRNAVEKHKGLHETLVRLGKWADGLSFNHHSGAGTLGILAAGFAHQKLVDVLGAEEREDLRILKLSSLYPLPVRLVKSFLRDCEHVLVLEENEPFVENQLKSQAHDLGLGVKILGKQSGDIPQEGELYRWQIQQILSKFIPEFIPAKSYLPEDEGAEYPQKENYCEGSGYDVVLGALEDAARGLDLKLALVADPGCLVAVGERLDAKYAIGSAIGVADGISKTGISERAVALFGDSSFFHTSLPALCNAVHNRSNILMIVLDNLAAASTGFQPTPGVGRDAFGREAPGLNIEGIARACGIEKVHAAGPEYLETELVSLFNHALSSQELALIVVRTRALPQWA